MTDSPISDPRAIRALAHPTRLALLEILAGEGTATATRCAELSGHSVASCSFHLRTLAKHGYIEAAPGAGKNKPWRLTQLRQRIQSHLETEQLDGKHPDGKHLDGRHPDGKQADSIELRAAGSAFDEFFLGHEFARLRAWNQRRDEESAAWRHATEMVGATAWLTPEELAEINAELMALVERHFVARMAEGAPAGGDRRPVRLFLANSVGLYDPERN